MLSPSPLPSSPAPASAMTREELHDEAELRLRDINQRLGALPQDKDGLLELLEDMDTWLIRLNQKKTRSMLDTLGPTKAILISRDLLDHPDPDVKLVVTSCLTEVTRITAPNAPYGDDVMKEIFKRMVGTFADLGDINSPSYERRVSILDSIARVKCCILMLDLQLDHLILNIFHYIFKAASGNHSNNVIQSMEDILRVVIEEIDDVHVELASCLLQNLTKEAQETLPASFELAERLVYICRDSLRPVFAQLLRGNPLDKYSYVVTLLCRNTPHAVADNNLDASGTHMAGEGKISERSIPEEAPQKTSKLEEGINCPGQDDTRLGIPPTIAIRNGGALGGNAKSSDGSSTSEPKPELLSGDERIKIDQLISGDKEVSEPVTCETDSKRNEKLDSSTGFEATEHSKVVKDNGSHVAAAVLPPETDHGDNKQLTEISKKAVDTTPAVTKKRGRPSAAKSQGKKPAIMQQASDLKSGKVYPINDSRRRITRQQSKEDTKSSSTETACSRKCNASMPTSTEAAFLGRDILKLAKERIVPDKDADEDTSLKEMVSATKMEKMEDQQEDDGVSKMKDQQEAEEAPPSKNNKMLDGNLVGSRIKVWWPEDKMFYNGVIESYDASSEKHKVAYDDGDVEMLLLKNERWEFTHEDQDGDPNAASDMPHDRSGEGRSSLQMERVKTGTSQSSSNGRNPPKKRGRPKGARSKNNTSNTDSPAGSDKLKGKGAEEDTQETPKCSRRIAQSIGEAKDDGTL